MAFAADLITKFTLLISKYGSDYTLTRTTSGGTLIDPLHPSKGYTTDSTTTHQITGYLAPYDKNLVNKGLMEVTDSLMYVTTSFDDDSTITFDSDTDKIEVNGKSFAIVTITPYSVNNDIVYYELILTN